MEALMGFPLPFDLLSCDIMRVQPLLHIGFCCGCELELTYAFFHLMNKGACADWALAIHLHVPTIALIWLQLWYKPLGCSRFRHFEKFHVWVSLGKVDCANVLVF